MREIKFRAWDKELKKMYIPVYFYDLNILFNLDLRHPLRLEGIGWWKDEKRENIDLMRFIGLYDNTKFEELTEKEKKEWLKNNKKEDWCFCDWDKFFMLNEIEIEIFINPNCRYKKRDKWMYALNLINYVNRKSKDKIKEKSFYKVLELLEGKLNGK